MAQHRKNIDMWYGDKFKPKMYHADAFFYPHSSAGFCYRGNIYNDSGEIIGDYGANCSVWIWKNFKIVWR